MPGIRNALRSNCLSTWFLDPLSLFEVRSMEGWKLMVDGFFSIWRSLPFLGPVVFFLMHICVYIFRYIYMYIYIYLY